MRIRELDGALNNTDILHTLFRIIKTFDRKLLYNCKENYAYFRYKTLQEITK